MTPGTRRRPAVLGETLVLDDVGPGRRSRAYPSGGFAALLLTPAALVLGGILLWPVVRTVQASLTGTDGGFAGLANFRIALAAEGTWAVLGRTVLWALVVPLIVMVLGYTLAATRRVGTLLLLAPIALPLVVTAVMFRLFYDPDPGRGTGTRILTSVAGLFGVAPDAVPSWLGPDLITVALMTAFVWAWIGLPVVVFRSALNTLPPDLADAVRTAGGSRLDVFRDALWRPLLRRTAAIVFALVALGTGRAFDLILVMAPGSSLDESATLAVRVWQTSTTTTGPAAALNTLWLLAVGAGVVLAAVGGRQAWPPPERPAEIATPARTPSDLPIARVVRRGLPILIALVWAVPVLALVATSLHTPQDAAARGWWAAALRLSSYTAVIRQDDLIRSLWFTGVLAVSVTVVVVLLALPAGYALARLRPPGTMAAGVLLVAASAVPVQLLAGPVNEVLSRIGLAGTSVGLGLVHVALGVPFTVLVLRNALTDVPGSRVRAARIAGRREWSVLWRVVPAAGPAIVAVAVLEFVQVWNDFVVGLLFGGTGTPLGVLLYGQTRQFVSNSGTLAAFCILASLPPLIAILLARRQVIRGLVSGAVR
jgi:alpha-glucoside transport system permease protein